MTPWETEILTIWRSDDGMLHSKYKQGAILNEFKLSNSYDLIIDSLKGEKVCWNVDITHLTFADKETREVASRKMPQFVKALGIVTDRPLSIMIANIYLSLKPPAFHVKMFSNERSSIDWLKKYL